MQTSLGRTLCALLTLCLGAVSAGASVDSIGAGSAVPGGAIAETHGWIVLPRPGEDGFVLAHLPPRQAALHRGVAGVARLARTLVRAPAAIAADGRRLYMVFDGDPRTMLSIEADPAPLDGVWRDLPVGRMRPHTPLPGEGGVLGLTIAAGRPTALLENAGRRRLLELEGDTWREIDPPDSANVEGRWSIYGDEDGLHLLVMGPASASLWSHDTETGWSGNVLAVPPDAVPVGMVRGRVVLLAGGADDPSLVSVLLAGHGVVSTVATTELPEPADGAGLGVLVLPDVSGRLCLLWAEKAARGEGYLYKIREISLSTGRVLYDGPVERVTPVSASEFRLLAVGLMLVLVVSLFVVLRPVSEPDTIVLPDGVALATPGRRLVATLLDVLLCAAPVSQVMGVPIGQIVTAGVLLDSGNTWVAIPAVFVVGAVYGTAMESLFGATIGKFLLGCRVIRVGGDGGVRQPGQGACFFRNLIKWVLPPVASLAFLEPSGRHRGDLIAGAVVAVRIDSPEKGAAQ